MLRGVSGNAPKKFTKVRKILRENDRTSVDPSLSGNGALVDLAPDTLNNRLTLHHSIDPALVSTMITEGVNPIF